MNDMNKIALFALIGGILFLALVVIVVILSATAPTDPEPSEQPTPSPPAQLSQPAGVEVDTAAIEAELGTDADNVTMIHQPDPGRIEVHTNMVDDGEPTSVNSMKAMAICEGVARVDNVDTATVYELDGTIWVVYGHPRYPDGCSIV